MKPLGKLPWRKVEAPKPWHPRFNGETLEGYYGGRTMRNGRFGQYEVVVVHVPARGSFMVSGTRVIQLVDSSFLDVGDPIKIVWGGYRQLATAEESDDGREHKMKLFEVFVVDGERMAPEDLPSVSSEPGQHGQHGS